MKTKGKEKLQNFVVNSVAFFYLLVTGTQNSIGPPMSF